MMEIFLASVALFIIVALLEGWDFSNLVGCFAGNKTCCWDFSNLVGCFAGNKTCCFAVVTVVADVKVTGEGVGMLMLFVFHSQFLLVLLFGLIIWCSSRLKRTIRHFCRTAIAWILWIHQMVCLVKYYVDVVTFTMGFLGALRVLNVVMLRGAPSGSEETALRALKDFFGSVSNLLKSLWKFNRNAR